MMGYAAFINRHLEFQVRCQLTRIGRIAFRHTYHNLPDLLN